MPESTTTQDLEQLRTTHQVRLIEGGEEGFSAGHLPNGVYGFTYAPQEAAVPLFSTKNWHSFEIHKLPDGSQQLLGFATPKDAEMIRSGFHVEVVLCPDPWQDATELVSVSMARIVPSKRGPSRDGGNELRLELL